MTIKTWRPDRPTSRGAAAYHDAVVKAFWHIENIDGLVKIIQKEIKDATEEPFFPYW